VKPAAAGTQDGMGDYEHTATVSVDPDELFRYLADVHHLPDYFSSMQAAEPTGEHVEDGDEVHVVADVEGKRREGDAWISVDDAARTLRWGSEGPNGYHGELEVEQADSGLPGRGAAAHRAGGRPRDPRGAGAERWRP
jgi:hypothetical protein